MKFLTILRRNLFGWKTSDLIEHLMQTGEWRHHHYMCIAIRHYLRGTWLRTSPHTNKIRARIGYQHTLSIYLARSGQNEWPTYFDEQTFWKNYIEELRAKGE